MLVELVADRAVALPPLDRETATALVGRLRVSTLLAGYRGSAPADIDALADAVVALGQLAVELGDHLDGVDLNPVMVGPHAAYVVDALVLPAPPKSGETYASKCGEVAPCDPAPQRGLSRCSHFTGTCSAFGGEGEGDGVGVEAAAAVLVEPVEPEVGDVDDVGRPGDREVGDRLGDPGAPHHPVTAGRGHERAARSDRPPRSPGR